MKKLSAFLKMFFLMVLVATITVPLITLTWSLEERLTTNPGFDVLPSITQTRDGKIWIVWSKEVLEKHALYYKTYSDLSWSNEKNLTQTPSSDYNMSPSIIQTMDGTIWVVWVSDKTGNDEIFYKTSNDNGASWSTGTQLTEYGGDDLKPSIIETMNGTIWVVWQSDRTGNYDIFYVTSSDGGLLWSDATQLTVDLESDRRTPSITQTNDGKIWVVWASAKTGNDELYYKIYDGFSWLDEVQLTYSGDSDVCPSIFQAFNGTIYMFWTRNKKIGDGDVYYKYSSDSGITWSNDIQFTTDINDDTWPDAIQAMDTKIWVVWTSNREDQPEGNYDLYYWTSSPSPYVSHDVAITRVTSSATTAFQGEKVSIEVLAYNQGTERETFEVRCYVNSTLVGLPQTISLDARGFRLLTFQWNTASFASGTYVIKAEAIAVSGETDTADNTLIDGQVTVYIRDLAVLNVMAYPTVVFKPDTVFINVTVKNEGDLTETFNVTAYYNLTALETQTVIGLVSGSEKTLSFTWNTTYVATGNYTISAEVSVLQYETDTADNTFIDGNVTVSRLLGAPEAFFTYSPEKPLASETITFNASASKPDGGVIISYEWNFGDGTKEIYVDANLPATATHAYTSFGTYMVALTVKDNDTLTDAIASYITVIDYPEAIFTYSPEVLIVNQNVTFDASTSKPKGGTITSYSWDFGDDTTGTGKIVNHMYIAFGTYIVNLTVADSEDLTNSTTATVTAHTIPVAFFTYTPEAPVVGQTITFNASDSYNLDGDAIVSYTWDFDDGTSGAEVIVTHSYVSSGTYVVKLTVKDALDLENMYFTSIAVSSGEPPPSPPPPSSSPWTIEVVGAVVATVVIGSAIILVFLRKRKGVTESEQ